MKFLTRFETNIVRNGSVNLIFGSLYGFPTSSKIIEFLILLNDQSVVVVVIFSPLRRTQRHVKKKGEG